jgi:hypothetical protein
MEAMCSLKDLVGPRPTLRILFFMDFLFDIVSRKENCILENLSNLGHTNKAIIFDIVSRKYNSILQQPTLIWFFETRIVFWNNLSAFSNLV